MDQCEVCAWAQGIMGSVRVEAVASYLGEGDLWLCEHHLQFLLNKSAVVMELYVNSWKQEIKATKAQAESMKVQA